jgi:hypothetical protein
MEVNVNLRWYQLNLTLISKSVQATVLQLYDMTFFYTTLELIHQKVQLTLPLNITFYYTDYRAPLLALLKTHQYSSTAEYFLIYVLNQTMINITSSPQH